MVHPVRRLALLLVLLSSGAARAGIDLTPRPSVYLAEGVKMPNLSFTDGKNEIAYTPPPDWKCEGDSSRLLLLPRNRVQAEASIEKTPPPITAVFDEAGAKKLTDTVVASLPRGSRKVAVLSQEKNPLRINGKETYEVVVSSVFFGQAVTTSAVFCTRGKEQLVFRLFCHSADFPELARAFRRSLYSFQGF